MRIKALIPLAFSAVMLLSSGCVSTETGKPAAGVPLTRDTIISRYEKPVPVLSNATREVLKRNGKLLIDNIVNNSFQAKINQHNVWVRVADVDGKISMVSVQARGPVNGDIDLAAEISKQIALQLTAPPQ